MTLTEVAKDYGSGYGSGYGYGYGYGYGSGSGSGYGSGYGDGSGSGYGDGYGDGSKTDYLKALLDSYSKPPLILGFWRSKKDGRPANGGKGEPRKLGQVEEIEGPLEICTARGLHATLDPDKWEGERWWIVGLHEPVQRQDDKMASLKREIIADLGIYPFSK